MNGGAEQVLKYVENIVRKAIESYNKYRCPETCAELMDMSQNKIVIKFRGYYCMTCGVSDWIEDLKYIMEDLGLETELIEIRDTEDGKLGTFRILKTT